MSYGGITQLTKANFKLYCLKAYENPDNPDLSSFEADLYNVSQVKRLISNYVDKNEIKDRLILNYITIVSNLFGPEATVKILFFKVEERYHPALKTFLRFLDLMPEAIIGLKSIIYDRNLPIDVDLFDRLEKL